MAAEDRRQQVARLVRQGRLARGLSLAGAAREADIDRGTWTGVEKATRIPRDAQAAAIERVAGLPPGTITDVMAGTGELTPAPVSRREHAYSVIINATREQILAMANAYAEAFGEQAAEAFLLRAAEIRNEAAGGDQAAGQG